MRIEEIIEQLGQHMSVDLKLDDKNTCQLIFDNRIVVDIEAPSSPGDIVFFSSAIGVIPPTSRELIFQDLLEGNLYGRGTGAAFLSIDVTLNEILLQRRLVTAKMDF